MKRQLSDGERDLLDERRRDEQAELDYQAYQDLIYAACEAEEEFDIDELELYAYAWRQSRGIK